MPAKPAARHDAATERPDPLWSKIFAAGQKTDIVLADSCLSAMQDILDADIPLQDYLSGTYLEKRIESVPDRQLREALKLLEVRQYTSLADVVLASRLVEIGRRYAAETNLRYSRFLSVREFKSGNFILVGSRRGIPWEQLFEAQLNFRLEEDRTGRAYVFRNLHPRPGEPAVYYPRSPWQGGIRPPADRPAATHQEHGQSVLPESGGDGETYADIALLPNLAGTGYVLILAGIDMAGTEAAGELVDNPEFPELLSKLAGPRAGTEAASSFEILLQARAVAGTTHLPKIAASRLLPGGSLAAGQSGGVPSR